MREYQTGSYLWTAIIALPTSVIFGLGVHLVIFGIHDLVSSTVATLLGLASAVAVYLLEHYIYSTLSAFTE